MTFHIITLFPEAFSYLETSIIKRAQEKKKIKIKFYNPRDFTRDPRKRADDAPYGGGPGMVMKAEPIVRAVEKAIRGVRRRKVKILFFSPHGTQFTHMYAERLSKRFTHVVLIAGRYEGIDERVVKILKAQKISIGPYVLTGGELPTMVVLDVLARYVKGVLGKEESLEEARTASPEVYTRPEVFAHKKKKYRVPKVLLSGDHKKIETWKREKIRGSSKP